MTLDRLAWLVRTIMVVVAAVVAYLLVQTEVVFDPAVNVLLGALAVGLAALNPTTVASKLPGTSSGG